MSYWAARGCLRYGHQAGARQILEAALDAPRSSSSARAPAGNSIIRGAARTALERKPFNNATGRHLPSRDYLGHNPLFAMAELWRRAESRAKK